MKARIDNIWYVSHFMASWLFYFRLPHKSQKVGSDRQNYENLNIFIAKKHFK